MYCEAQEIMQKNEEYARGWLLLYGEENTSTVLSMAQYAVDLTKLKRNHMEKCWLCSQQEKVNAQEEGTGSTHSGSDFGLARS